MTILSSNRFNFLLSRCRPRYMIDKIVQISKSVSKSSDATSLVFLVLDDHGTSCSSFMLSVMPKDPNPQQTLKTMENKVKEAKYAYEIALWMSRNPTRDISEMDLDLKAEYAHYKKPRNEAEESHIEQEARESVLCMLHRGMGANQDSNAMTSTFYNYDTIVMGVSARPPGRNYVPHLVHRTITSSLPYQQRLQIPQHTSTMSLQEPGTSALQVQRSNNYMEYLQPPPLSASGSAVTVRVISESESETMTPQRISLQPSPTPSRSSMQTSSTHTLRVQEPQNNVTTLIHSLPDLTIEPSTPRTTSSPTHPIHMSASVKLYKSHQQLLSQRHKTQGQYLTPDQRGASYPPPSPTRASLKRGLAFSYSFKHPPLYKMGHVASQSTTQFEPVPSTSQQVERTESPRPCSSLEKTEKKSKLTSSRRKRRDISQDRYSEPCTSRRDESPDPFRREESPSPSYRDESPGTSYRDESTDLSGIDRSSSLSHKDESPGTSYRGESPAYRDYRRSSSGRDKSSERSHEESPDPRSVELSPSSSYREKSPERYRDSSGSDRHKDMSSSPSRGSVSPDPAQRKKSFSSKAVSLSPIASTDEIPGLSIGDSSRTSLKEDDSQKSPDYRHKEKSPSARITDESWSDSTERLEIRKPALRPTREQTPGPSRKIRSLSPVVICDIPIFYQGESSSNIIQPTPLKRGLEEPSTSTSKPSPREKRRSFFRRSKKKEKGTSRSILESCISGQKSDSESEYSSKEPSPSSSAKSKTSENGKRRWFRRS
ncbi:unnamed protein product [Danaus chrysippus]|uniref:(African queen) hypothetical protein n=1 Tax=Danaus chrysippus TaxID=151541 RepID=A0A8J2Q575_9NEOP|nr:unnamed protein product [Danaus chrysippus]